jgi:hypothetical protein
MAQAVGGDLIDGQHGVLGCLGFHLRDVEPDPKPSAQAG